MKKYLDLTVALALLLALIFPKFVGLFLILAVLYSALKHIVSRGVPFFKKLP